MKRAKPRGSISVQELLIVFQGMRALSGCLWGVYSAPLVVRLYQPGKLYYRLVSKQRLIGLMRAQSQHEQRGRSGMVKLFGRISSQRLVIVQNLQGLAARKSRQVAE